MAPIIEHEIADSFSENITNIDPKTGQIVTQSNNPDLFLIGYKNETISVKSGKDGIWITQSALFDVKHWTPKSKCKRTYSPEEWDKKHHEYMTKYDYILLVDNSEFELTGCFRMLLVKPEILIPYGRFYGNNKYPHKITKLKIDKLMCVYS